MELVELAWDEDVDNDAQVIYRLMYWKRRDGRSLRSTHYFTDVDKLNAKLQRIAADDLILVRKYRLAAPSPSEREAPDA